MLLQKLFHFDAIYFHVLLHNNINRHSVNSFKLSTNL